MFWRTPLDHSFRLDSTYGDATACEGKDNKPNSMTNSMRTYRRNNKHNELVRHSFILHHKSERCFVVFSLARKPLFPNDVCDNLMTERSVLVVRVLLNRYEQICSSEIDNCTLVSRSYAISCMKWSPVKSHSTCLAIWTRFLFPGIW